MSARVEMDGADAHEGARVTRLDDAVALSEVGLEHAGVGSGQPLQTAASRWPETAQRQPAVHHHPPHFRGFEVEQREVVEVAWHESAPAEPAGHGDHPFPAAAAAAPFEPRPAKGRLDGKAVARILGQPIRGDDDHSGEPLRLPRKGMCRS